MIKVDNDRIEITSATGARAAVVLDELLTHGEDGCVDPVALMLWGIFYHLQMMNPVLGIVSAEGKASGLLGLAAMQADRLGEISKQFETLNKQLAAMQTRIEQNPPVDPASFIKTAMEALGGAAGGMAPPAPPNIHRPHNGPAPGATDGS